MGFLARSLRRYPVRVPPGLCKETIPLEPPAQSLSVPKDDLEHDAVRLLERIANALEQLVKLKENE
jgi:hypothetical protein